MIARDQYLKKIISKQNNGLVKIITGIRRCGKSFLLFNIYRNYLIENGVNPNHIISIELDEIINQKYRNPNELDKYIRESIINDGKVNYIFIDEIQNVKQVDNPYVEGDKIGFIDVLLGLMKIPNVDVYVTGSNSKMLSKDIATEFRGRGDEIRVHPLSFKEFYDAYEGDKYSAWDEYSLYGGMPFLSTLKTHEEKRDYLKSLLDKVYITDIIERNKLKKDNVFVGELLDILSSSIGSLVSQKKLSNTYKSITNDSVSINTISNYMSYYEDAFLITKVQRYDIKGREYIDSPFKYYFEDIGLRNVRINFRQNEPTHTMENIIYNELIIRGYSVDVGIVEVNYKDEDNKSKRKQYEIDFVCNKGDHKYYIQSAFVLENQAKIDQETRGLNRINDSFKKIVIVKDCYIPWRDENGILYIGLEYFLLNSNSLEI